MRVVAVDDELQMLEQFKSECERYDDIVVEGLFDEAHEALQYLKEHEADVLFLDVQMPEMDGIELARHVKKKYPKIIIVFISAYEVYAIDAMRLKTDYYLLKPYSSADFDEVMENVRLLMGRLKKQIRIQCFGRFQVFFQGKPIVFRSQKARELLAVLVDKRGALVMPEEAFNLIWEDKPYNNYTGSAYRKALSKLVETLKENNCEDILLRSAKGCAINKSVVTCDFYEYLEGKSKQFDGEYMQDYSWGEFTLAGLMMGKGCF